MKNKYDICNHQSNLPFTIGSGISFEFKNAQKQQHFLANVQPLVGAVCLKDGVLTDFMSQPWPLQFQNDIDAVEPFCCGGSQIEFVESGYVILQPDIRLYF